MQYFIRDKSSLFSRDLTIDDQRGQSSFRVHGPLVRVRDELRLDDANGVEQAWIKDLVLSDGSTYEIYRAGTRYADVKRILDGDLLTGYDIVVSEGETLRARGDLLGRNFTIMAEGQLAARVQRRHGDSLEVDVEHADEVLLLAGVVAINAMLDTWARAHPR
jgi:uncharacterized protein YxjI